MTKRVLLLTFFYPPDLSAGSFRAHALVEAMRLQTTDEVQIDVLTTQPNRYDAHANAVESIEQSGNVRIRRVQLPAHKSGMLDQSRAFVQFAFRARRIAREQQYDLVVASSSRLMTAVLGTWIAHSQGAKLYLDIRDLFVKNLCELFSAPIAKPLTIIFGSLERLAIGRADRVNLVSRGFLDYFNTRYPDKKFSLFTNGVDKDFIDFPLSPLNEKNLQQPLQVLYAGNVGDGQGLHLIIPQLAKQLEGKVNFRIVGAGGRLLMMQRAIEEQALGNVELIAPVARGELLSMYHQSDVLFLHLNDFQSFRRVLPSKLFEYAATGKPIWAGVEGYAAEFIAKEVTNAEVFAPCDVAGALQAFEALRFEQIPRPEFVKQFARNQIMTPMAREVLELMTPAD